MKFNYVLIIGLILAVSLLVEGCAFISTNVNSNSGAATASPTSYNFTGHGDQTTKAFHLNKGVASFTSKQDTAVKFMASLLDSNGNVVQIVADNEDTDQHSYNVTISADGDYSLNIKTQSGWTMDVSE